MKQRFILFRRAGVFYYEDTTTGQQLSLRTKDEAEALTLLHSKNEAHRQLNPERRHSTGSPGIWGRPNARRPPAMAYGWALTATR